MDPMKHSKQTDYLWHIPYAFLTFFIYISVNSLPLWPSQPWEQPVEVMSGVESGSVAHAKPVHTHKYQATGNQDSTSFQIDKPRWPYKPQLTS